MAMAIRWRCQRLIYLVLVLVLCVMLLTLRSAIPSGSVHPKDAENRVEEAANKDKQVYINRPLDLSSPQGSVSRLLEAQSACASRPDGDTMNILMYQRKPSVRMSYCVVAKTGCTFWIRVFRFLNNDTAGMNVSTPFDIDRSLAHDARRRQMKMYRLQDARDRAEVENSTRFMFARDPYSRVWSAYVDKLLLPSNYWGSVGKTIAGRRLNGSHPGASDDCGNDVTFEEFVQFIVEKAERSGSRSLDGHWRPIQYVCDPCKFKPLFIGKQETFMADSQAILKHFQLEHLLNGYSREVYRRDEVSILTDYNFAQLRIIPRRCSTPLQLAERLWAVFRLNGHLPPTSNSSILSEMKTQSAAAFKQLVYRKQERDWEAVQHGEIHRRIFMVAEYRKLPRALLERFVALYAMDFELFGYEKRPREIYADG